MSNFLLADARNPKFLTKLKEKLESRNHVVFIANSVASMRQYLSTGDIDVLYMSLLVLEDSPGDLLALIEETRLVRPEIKIVHATIIDPKGNPAFSWDDPLSDAFVVTNLSGTADVWAVVLLLELFMHRKVARLD